MDKDHGRVKGKSRPAFSCLDIGDCVPNSHKINLKNTFDSKTCSGTIVAHIPRLLGTLSKFCNSNVELGNKQFVSKKGHKTVRMTLNRLQ